jgi:hypothetical protein
MTLYKLTNENDQTHGGMRVHKSVRMADQDLCDDWVASVQSQNVKDGCPCIGKVIPSMKIPEI